MTVTKHDRHSGSCIEDTVSTESGQSKLFGFRSRSFKEFLRLKGLGFRVYEA